MHMHHVGGRGGSVSSFCSLRQLETSLRAGSLHLLIYSKFEFLTLVTLSDEPHLKSAVYIIFLTATSVQCVDITCGAGTIKYRA